MIPDTHSSLRAALQHAVDDTGLRCVARSAEINVQSLANFLTCATRPLPGTVDKLRRWHHRQQGGGTPGRPDELTVCVALDALTGQLQGEPRERLRRRLLGVLREEWRGAGVAVPTWAEELATSVGDGPHGDGEHPRRHRHRVDGSFTDGGSRAPQPFG